MELRGGTMLVTDMDLKNAQRERWLEEAITEHKEMNLDEMTIGAPPL